MKDVPFNQLPCLNNADRDMLIDVQSKLGDDMHLINRDGISEMINDFMDYYPNHGIENRDHFQKIVDMSFTDLADMPSAFLFEGAAMARRDSPRFMPSAALVREKIRELPRYKKFMETRSTLTRLIEASKDSEQ